MLNKIKHSLSEQKGGAEILVFVVLSPIFVWFFMYILLGGAYLLKINDMTNIVNKKLDRALVQGQFTTTLKEELKNELVAKGFEESKLEITVTPNEAYDNDNDTYVTREEEIEIKVIHKKPHPFYYVNFKPGQESRFYIGTKIEGMSEKW